jgi:hypothetical protein
MRNHLPLALAVLALGLTALSAPTFAAESDKNHEGKDTRQDTELKKTLYHVVSIKFKDTATPEQIRAVEDAFRGLKAQVPGITSMTWGTNVSPEKKNMGFTHCFVLTFADDKDRDAYLNHPAHKEFGNVLKPVMADVFVIDFWAKE